jgi:hypothetical protein
MAHCNLEDSSVISSIYFVPVHVARMGERRGLCRVLVGKPKGKSPLGRPWSRWEDNIKMDIQEVGCGSLYWMELAQDRDRWRAFVTAVMNFRVL